MASNGTLRSLHRLLGAPEVVSIVSVTGGSGRRRAAACVRGGLYGVSILEHLIELLGIAFSEGRVPRGRDTGGRAAVGQEEEVHHQGTALPVASSEQGAGTFTGSMSPAS